MSPLPLRTALAAACALALAACQPVVRPDPVADEALPVPVAPESVATTQPAPEDHPAPAEDAAAPAEPAPPPIPAMGKGEDVFSRIRKGLSPGTCTTGPSSVRWRKRYAASPAMFARHLEEVLPLMDFVSIEVERANLPTEFVFIPLVESWYRPNAVSSGGPAGMWQMIGSTARNHGVNIRPGYDGRLSPVESTRAALSYLRTLQDQFPGDWRSTVMAYNAGEGRIRAAFRKARSRDVSATKRQPHGLSNITYDYVAKLQALSCLISEPEREGLLLPLTTRFVPVVPVLVDASVKSVDEFSRQQGLDIAEVRRLNPGFKGGRIVEGVPRLLLMPTLGRQALPPPVADVDASGAPPALLAMEASSAAAGTGAPPAQHEVRPGESLWKIARLYGLDVADLRRINRLSANAMVHPGQVLKLVP